MANGLCKWSAGLKVRNFQLRTEPIRLFIISNFPSIVADELAVLQQRETVGLPTETRITFTFCCVLSFQLVSTFFKNLPIASATFSGWSIIVICAASLIISTVASFDKA